MTKLQIGSEITPTKPWFAGFNVGVNYEVVHINKGSGNPKVVNDHGHRITISENYKIVSRGDKAMSVISKKIRNSARGQECQVRIPGICNHNPETVILAHVGKGAGMGQKCDDIHATYACSACHDVIDGRTPLGDPRYNRIYAYEGMVRTQKLLLEQELIQVAK